MAQLTIRNLAELDDRFLDQTVRLFVEGFFKTMGDSIKLDVQTIAKGVKHSFIKDHYYAALLDGKVLGILAVSTNRGRSHAFDKSVLQRELGYFKGTMLYFFLKKELQNPVDLRDDQIYIESVTTSEDARGKGVATSLMNFLFDSLNGKEFVLEVVDTNANAIRLYEKLGFVLFKRKKAGFLDKKGGFNERLYMKRAGGKQQ